jgi:hypothetical protein
MLMLARWSLLMVAMVSSGCSSMAVEPLCFAHRPSMVLPDRQLALSHLSGGEAARALAEAVWDGDRDRAAQLLKADPRLLSAQVQFDKRMQSPPPGQYGDLLAFAVSRCDSAMVQMLLSSGMPPDGVQKGEALIVALLADTPEMADLILNAGASPDPQKVGGKNLVHELSAMGGVGGIQTLIRHGLDVNWVDAQGNDHLDTALTMEQYVIAEHLVRAGAKLWRINGAGALSAWTLSKEPVLAPDRENIAARSRLLASAQVEGLPWPAPDPEKVRQMVLAKTWPTGAMAKAGMLLSAEAAADVKARFANEAR